MVFTKTARLWNGPSFRGLKPILVTFHLFKDKEDILRKSGLLRGCNIYITEDYSRKVRRQREELLKFAKMIKSRSTVAPRCLLQYDRLHVDNDVYLYNEIEQRVQKVLMKIPELAAGMSSLVLTFDPCIRYVLSVLLQILEPDQPPHSISAKSFKGTRACPPKLLRSTPTRTVAYIASKK